ncbi:MAG: hypothetical protein P4L49_05320 [Desulfosporosinus sp.]|nr:hypothetical protein [Desulfosporosinus sp.]
MKRRPFFGANILPYNSPPLFEKYVKPNGYVSLNVARALLHCWFIATSKTFACLRISKDRI